RRLLGAYSTEATDLTVRDGQDQLSLTRHYNSLFIEPTTFGRGWTMLLPRLYRRQPVTKEEKANAVQTRQPDGTVKTLPIYVLTDDFGTTELVFRPDSASPSHTVRYLCNSRAGVRSFNPLEEGKPIRLAFHNGQVWEFDNQGHLTAKKLRGRTVRYVYRMLRGGRCQLDKVVRETPNKESLWIALDYDPKGRIAQAVGSDGSKVTYEYDENDLASVTDSRKKLLYAYNDNHLLTWVACGGIFLKHITYDELGRLDMIHGPGDRKLADFEFSQKDGQLVVEESQKDRRLVYNGQRQLAAVEHKDRRTEYEYHKNGALKKASQKVGNNENVFSFSENGDQATWETQSGARMDYLLDHTGNVRSMSINGDRVAQLTRNPSTQEVTRAVFPTFRYQNVADKQGVRKIIHPTQGTAVDRRPIDLRYAPDGKLTQMTGPGDLKVNVQYDGDLLRSITTPRREVSIHKQKNIWTVASTDGRKTVVRRNDRGKVEAITETVGEASREQRFMNGHLVEIQNYDQGITQYHWDKKTGLLTGVTDAMQSNIQYHYHKEDGGYRLAAVEFPNHRTIAFTTDARGRTTEIRE
ncbi:MAG: hypothetical protein PVH19_06660, partial [Planctomycetia bacterium]